jgi:hypothetical protein
MNTNSTTSGSSKTVTATCDAGWVAVGGGGQISDDNDAAAINDSYPSSDSAWTVRAVEFGNDISWTLTTYVLCIEDVA